MSWILLAISIVAEVAGSATLMRTKQFSRLWPSLFTLLLYAIVSYRLALSLRQISLDIACSVWAGCGIVLTALVGVLFYRQQLDAAAIIGILFISVDTIIEHASQHALQCGFPSLMLQAVANSAESHQKWPDASFQDPVPVDFGSQATCL